MKKITATFFIETKKIEGVITAKSSGNLYHKEILHVWKKRMFHSHCRKNLNSPHDDCSNYSCCAKWDFSKWAMLKYRIKT